MVVDVGCQGDTRPRAQDLGGVAAWCAPGVQGEGEEAQTHVKWDDDQRGVAMGAVEGVNDFQSRTEDHYDQQTVQETGNDVLKTNTNTLTSNHRNKKKTHVNMQCRGKNSCWDPKMPWKTNIIYIWKRLTERNVHTFVTCKSVEEVWPNNKLFHSKNCHKQEQTNMAGAKKKRNNIKYLFTPTQLFGTKIQADFYTWFVCSDQCVKTSRQALLQYVVLLVKQKY